MTLKKDIIIQFLITFNEMAGIAPDTIFSISRKQHIALTREIAFYVLRENEISHRLIAESFEKLGGSKYDHSTIFHGWQQIKNMLCIYKNDVTNLANAGFKLYADITSAYNEKMKQEMEMVQKTITEQLHAKIQS